LTNPNHHPLAIDVFDAQVDEFGYPQSGVIGQHEEGFLLGADDLLKHLLYFFATEHDWQSPFLLGTRDGGHAFRTAERVLIEMAYRVANDDATVAF